MPSYSACIICRRGSQGKECGPIGQWRTLVMLSRRNTAPNDVDRNLCKNCFTHIYVRNIAYITLPLMLYLIPVLCVILSPPVLPLNLFHIQLKQTPATFQKGKSGNARHLLKEAEDKLLHMEATLKGESSNSN